MCKINFVNNMTSKEAFNLLLKCLWVIIKNTGKSINGIVYKYPWVIISLVVIASFIVSFVNIANARAERDNYNKEYTQTKMKLDSYIAVYDK